MALDAFIGEVMRELEADVDQVVVAEARRLVAATFSGDGEESLLLYEQVGSRALPAVQTVLAGSRFPSELRRTGMTRFLLRKRRELSCVG